MIERELLEITALQKWLFVGAGFFICVGLYLLWHCRSKVQKPHIKGHKTEYYSNGEVFTAKMFRRRLP